MSHNNLPGQYDPRGGRGGYQGQQQAYPGQGRGGGAPATNALGIVIGGPAPQLAAQPQYPAHAQGSQQPYPSLPVPRGQQYSGEAGVQQLFAQAGRPQQQQQQQQQPLPRSQQPQGRPPQTAADATQQLMQLLKKPDPSQPMPAPQYAQAARKPPAPASQQGLPQPRRSGVPQEFFQSPPPAAQQSQQPQQQQWYPAATAQGGPPPGVQRVVARPAPKSASPLPAGDSMLQAAASGGIDYDRVQDMPNWKKFFDDIVRQFAESSDAKEMDFPGTLRPQVRAHIHKLGMHYRVEHASHGKEGSRVLKLWKHGHQVNEEHQSSALGPRPYEGYCGVQPLNDEFLLKETRALSANLVPLATTMRKQLLAHIRKASSMAHRQPRPAQWFTRAAPGGAAGQQSQEYRTLQKFRHSLPSFKRRAELVDAVKNNAVTVVCGDTGCGKTTQIPQLLLDSKIFDDDKVIICTQPRRVSAISVAQRVAKERGEACGDTVGYVIRFENNASVRTRIVYVTTGILLRRLHNDPTLQGVAAVIVDEVHERDVDTDFAMLLLRDVVMKKQSALRLVVMSATIQIDRLQHYFQVPGMPAPPMISIPGSLFPVEEHYLDDACRWLNIDPNTVPAMQAALKVRSGGEAKGADFAALQAQALDNIAKREEQTVPFDVVVGLIERYHRLWAQNPDSAILVFLPGWAAIERTQKMLQRSGIARELSILPLHSTLTTAEQQRVFAAPPKRFRKVVLSTNIAETSLTIDDIVLVIDSGLHKGTGYDSIGNTSSLQSQLIARANGLQRRGRAGRVRAGVCVHLLPKMAYQALPEFLPPEILRTPLEELCLQVKAVMPDEKCIDVLNRALDGPPEQSVSHAVTQLNDLGALDQTERPTPLGKVLAALPMHPSLSKMLLFGCVLGVFDPLCTVAASLSGKSPFLNPLPHQQNDAKASKQKFDAGRKSDHLAALSLFAQWKRAARPNDFAYQNFADHFTLRSMDRMREQMRRLVLTSGFLKGLPAGWESRHASNEPLIRFALLSSLYPRLAVVENPKKKRPMTGYCWDSKAVQFGRNSLLDRTRVYDLREREFAVYFDRMRMESQLTIFDATSVTRTAAIIAAKTVRRVERTALPEKWHTDDESKYKPFDEAENTAFGALDTVLEVDGGKKRWAVPQSTAVVLSTLREVVEYFFAVCVRTIDAKHFPQEAVDVLATALGQPAVVVKQGEVQDFVPSAAVSLAPGEAALRPESDDDSGDDDLDAPMLEDEDDTELTEAEADLLTRGFGDLSWVASRTHHDDPEAVAEAAKPAPAAKAAAPTPSAPPKAEVESPATPPPSASLPVTATPSESTATPVSEPFPVAATVGGAPEAGEGKAKKKRLSQRERKKLKEQKAAGTPPPTASPPPSDVKPVSAAVAPPAVAPPAPAAPAAAPTAPTAPAAPAAAAVDAADESDSDGDVVMI